MMACPNCGEMKLSHNICPSCGFYDGKQVITIKEKTVVEEEVKEIKQETKAKNVPAEVKSVKKPAKKIEVTESSAPKKQTRRPAKTTSQA